MVFNRPVCVQICSQESAMSKNKSAACFKQWLGAPLVKGLFPYSIRPRSCFQSWVVYHDTFPFIKDPISEPPVVKRPKSTRKLIGASLFSLGGTDLSHPKVIVLMGLQEIQPWNNMT